MLKITSLLLGLLSVITVDLNRAVAATDLPQRDGNIDRANNKVAMPYTADYYFYGVVNC